MHGFTLSATGDVRGAERQYARAREVFKPPARDPNDPFPQDDGNWWYLDQLVRTAIEWGRIPEAVGLARAVVSLYPGTARAHATYGQALAASGNPRSAEAAYTRALEIDPNDTRALESRRRLRR